MNDKTETIAIADRLDTLMGIFAIGQPPTGDKDPFGLRRAALGVLRIMIEQELDLDLHELIAIAAAIMPGNWSGVQAKAGMSSPASWPASTWSGTRASTSGSPST